MVYLYIISYKLLVVIRGGVMMMMMKGEGGPEGASLGEEALFVGEIRVGLDVDEMGHALELTTNPRTVGQNGAVETFTESEGRQYVLLVRRFARETTGGGGGGRRGE